MENENVEIIQIGQNEIIKQEASALIDQQISTAKAYPRDLRRIKDNVTVIVTMDEETAKSCSYSLPRGGKSVNGASVHLARIIVQQYGNIRAEAKVVGTDRTHVISEAMCWDLETNTAVKVSVRRKITDKNGNRYNDDMITVTGNAANAIAFRNAVFSVVPKSIVDYALKSAKNMITGDLSDEQKLVTKRTQIFDRFKDNYKIKEEDLLKIIGLQSINQVKQDQIAELIGLGQALKDGDTTVEELMSDINKEKSKAEQKEKSAQIIKNAEDPEEDKDKKNDKKPPVDKKGSSQGTLV